MVTWKGIRATFRWLILLVLLGVITAGGLVAHWWGAKDSLLGSVIHQHLEDAIPECIVEFETTRLVDAGHLELTNLIVRSRVNGTDLLRVPRIVVEVDTSILKSFHRLVIREIMAQSPEVVLFRTADQRWNWEGISIHPPPSATSPVWTIKNGTVRIGCLSPDDGKLRTINLQGVQASLEPESFQRYGFSAAGVADTLGPIQVTGFADSQLGEWKMQGIAGEIRITDPLLDLAGRFTPRVREHLSRLRQSNRALIAQTQGNLPRQTASTDLPEGASANEKGSPSLMRADVAIQFSAGQTSAGGALDFDISGTIDHGHVSDALLPLPLYDLEGRFRITPTVLEIHDLKAANGSSTLFVDGRASRVGSDWSKDFLVRATQLRLDERIRGLLWGSLAKTFDMLRPSGTFDIDVKLSQAAGHSLQYEINKFAVIDCRAICDYFRYPLDHINGEITQDGTGFRIAMQGLANEHPVAVSGIVDLSNQQRDVEIQVRLKDFPFDNAAINAFQRPDQAAIRHILDALRVQGTIASATVDIIRSRDTGDDVVVGLQGELTDGNLNYKGFPYEVTNLKGKISFDPLKRRVWVFDEMSGSHGQARISGRGFYDMEQGPGLLALEMAVLQADLDHDLEEASTTANPNLATAWNDFGIRGSVDVDQVSVHWSPDTACQVALSGIHWNNGQFRPSGFPYPWNNVSGTLEWIGNRLKIHSLQGDHNGTYLLVNGAVPDTAYVEIEPSRDVAWKLHLDERILHIIKVNPDDELRRALPKFIADTLNSVQLRQPVDLSIGLEMKGWLTNQGLITASWSALTAFKENSLNIGVPLTDVTGNIVHRGSWDGQNLWMEGYAELEDLNALDLTLHQVRGPFLVKNNRLTLGVPKLSGNEPVYNPSNPYRQEQMRAGLYGGQLGLDVDVSLSGPADSLPYQLEVTVNDAELAEWAREHQINTQRLSGKVNGVLQATGKGASAQSTTGQGWIQITPAALYELPVFAQMFTVLSFRPAQPGDAAFKYAYGDFVIHDGLFDFTKIELWGDALSLVGRGSVGYAGSKAAALELDFYSMANNRIPFLGPLVRAVSDRWIRVQIFGTMSQPVARIQPRIPYLNDAFSGFMQALENGQPQRTPPRPNRAAGAVSPGKSTN